MAKFAILSCFLLVVFFYTCSQIEARESKFFYKYVHLSEKTNNYVTVPSHVPKKDLSSSSPTPAPAYAPVVSEIRYAPAPAPVDNQGYAPAPAPVDDQGYASTPTPVDDQGYTPAPTPVDDHGYASAPTPVDDQGYAPAPLESESSYYGLYGKGTNDFPPKKATLVDVEMEDEFRYEKRTDKYEPRGMSDTRSLDNGNTYSSRFSTSNDEGYNTNVYYDSRTGYKSEPQGMSDTRLLDNGNTYWSSFSTSNDESRLNTNGYHDLGAASYRGEPQGMSDTRLLDNGKYYHDMNHEPSGQEWVRENNEEQSYYGNHDNKSKYEFDSMEEYEKQQGYPDVQQYFNP